MKQPTNSRTDLLEEDKMKSTIMKKKAPIWSFRFLVIVMRIFFGVGWLLAGITKITDKAWFSKPGVFLKDYLLAALGKPNVPVFYKHFIESVVLTHVPSFNYVIPIVQIIIGIFLITGFLILPSILVCLFMHINFILSGNMNLISLTLYTSAFGLLLSRRYMYLLSLDQYFKVKNKLSLTIHTQENSNMEDKQFEYSA